MTFSRASARRRLPRSGSARYISPPPTTIPVISFKVAFPFLRISAPLLALSFVVLRPPVALQIELPAGAARVLAHHWFGENPGTIARRRKMIPESQRRSPGPPRPAILRMSRAQPPGRQLRFLPVVFFEGRQPQPAWKNQWQDHRRPESQSGREPRASDGRFGIPVH